MSRPSWPPWPKRRVGRRQSRPRPFVNGWNERAGGCAQRGEPSMEPGETLAPERLARRAYRRGGLAHAFLLAAWLRPRLAALVAPGRGLRLTGGPPGVARTAAVG